MVKLQVCASLLALTCGQILCWRRRDNVAGYLAGGLFFASVIVPLFGTSVLDGDDPALVARYANILTVGAIFFLLGLALGAHPGNHGRLPSVSFDQRLRLVVPTWLVRRSRLAGAAGVLSLVAAFKLLGYVPLLASDRQSAKYGVAAYRAGFERGSVVYHLAIALAGAALPIMLVVAYRYRRRVDIAVCALLGLGLAATLSRADALTGPLVFLVALAVERGLKPGRILAGVCLAFVAGTVANEIAEISPTRSSPSIAQRVAVTTPDISDQLAFLRGFRQRGEEYVGARTIGAALSVGRDKGDYDASLYALRNITGFNNVDGLASGGARLPAPVWGYAAYGFSGAAAWSFVAGVFIGWGTTMVRRLVSQAVGAPGQSLNLVLADLFFTGTFGLLASFYFPQRASIVILGLALFLGLAPRLSGQRRDEIRLSASVRTS
ncbi:MAG: hypothetical protein ACRD1K_11695 [Acidimicrobiales bacterium]